MRQPRFILSLSLLLAASALSAPTWAQALDPAQATILLAKSNVINQKCSVLPSAEGQQLRDFVARAEISLAEKVSVAAARKAIAEGRSQGELAACDESNRKSVNDVLAAANTASQMAVATATPEKPAEPKKPITATVAVAQPQAPQPKAIVAPAAPKQAVILKPKKVVAPVKTAEPVRIIKPLKIKDKLQGYSKVAETYYSAMKCRSLDRDQMAKLYENVLQSHKEALANNRPRDVKAMLQSAEARANERSCG
jgi:outer membrane biosynthesis protein TonB